MNENTKHSIDLHGPFHQEYHVASVGGYEIPNLKILKRKGKNDGISTVLLDNRFSIDVPEDQLDPWLWIVANAMAIGAGYSSHGENSCEVNPYKRRIAQL